jgi:hypothetical protein
MTRIFVLHGSTSLYIPGTQDAKTQQNYHIVKGSFELSDICDNEFHKMAQSFGTTAKYGESKGKAERGTSSTPTRSSPEKIIDDSPEAKKLRVHTKDPNNSHQTSLGLLPPRQHSFSKAFSARYFELVK